VTYMLAHRRAAYVWAALCGELLPHGTHKLAMQSRRRADRGVGQGRRAGLRPRDLCRWSSVYVLRNLIRSLRGLREPIRMIYLFILVVRGLIWLSVFAVAAAAVMAWALMWIVVFILSAIYVFFRDGHAPKRLKRPRWTLRDDDREQDAFGQQTPQARYSNRR